MTNTITRADIAEKVFRELGLSRTESAELVDAIMEEVAIALEKGETVKLSSFGTFKVRSKNARMGRNPRTKEEIPITPRKVVTFHTSNIMAKKINS